MVLFFSNSLGNYLAIILTFYLPLPLRQVWRVPHEFVLMASKLLCTQVSQPGDDSWDDDDTCPKTKCVASRTDPK